ncbi:MAG: ketoacyl reductase [Clostridium sp. 28_12]|nr:MAG: ketoacyl reductase [Clostridium sp. 28_12]
MKALITGASSGIGRDIAKELSKKGYDLVLVARNLEKLNEVKEKLETNIETVSMDISNPENCKQLYEKYKDIDILVNNAGFGDCGYFDKTNLEKELQMINTNIVAYHVLTKLYLKDMKAKNSGKILNVASIAGFMPGPLMATYYSTKAYVVRLSEAIREELKKESSKVQISILCPGPVDTNFNKVADVQFALKGLSSEYVAKYTTDKLFKGKFYIVPGWKIKLAKFGAKIAPNALVAKICYNMQKRKI